METKLVSLQRSADIIDFMTGQMRVSGATALSVAVAVETPLGITFSDSATFVRRDRGVCPFCRKIVPADGNFPHGAHYHDDGACPGIGLPTGPAPRDN